MSRLRERPSRHGTLGGRHGAGDALGGRLARRPSAHRVPSSGYRDPARELACPVRRGPAARTDHLARTAGSVLVPVLPVRGVTVAVVFVVDVVTVAHRVVTAPIAMSVLVLTVDDVDVEFAFVPVAFVLVMGVAIVQIVRVPFVLDGDVAATVTVCVVVLAVGVVGGVGHC